MYSTRSISSGFSSLTTLLLISCLVLITETPVLGQTDANNRLKSLRVDQDRLEASIFQLAEFGKDQESGQTSRVAFSDADIKGREYVIGLMRKAGLEVSVDYAGNIVGKRQGKDPNKSPIAFGSHIDMVPNGGNYDGCVGSMAGIEIMTLLQEQGIVTEHPLELIIFSNEEGGVMGSRAMVGELGPEALKVRNSTGYSMAEGISRLGGDPGKLSQMIRKKGDLAAFLELHIEQGGILELENTQIGVVEGIVGLNWWDVEVEGFANHAGTTPMDMRKDALLAAAEFVIAVNEVTNSYEGKQVGTVGMISAEPGAPNVIPGKVKMSLEIRDLSSEKILSMYEDMRRRADSIGAATGVKFSFSPTDATGKPALTDPLMRSTIDRVAGTLGFTTKHMQSGAGHDAQDMARIAPTGMIFVPSKGGISHSPDEFTSAQDMANGANVLLHTVLSLDRELDLKD